jgi:hypothetical protein
MTIQSANAQDHVMKVNSRADTNVSRHPSQLGFLLLAALSICCFGASPVAFSQQDGNDRVIAGSHERAAVTSRAPEALRQLDTSLIALTNRVSPAVVQIMVDGYGPSYEQRIHNSVSDATHQRAIGSGVIVDSAGYILTNAHVVEGAQRIRVALPQPAGASLLEMSAVGKRKVLDATLIGIHKESDLALLKVAAQGLPAARCQGPKMNRFQRKILNRSQNIRTSANGQADNSTIAELLARRWTETRPYFTHRTPLFAWMMLGLSASAFLAACATVQVASDYEGAGLQGYRTAGRAHQQGRERSTCQIPTSLRPECLALLP